jgi:hypothetical protein
MMRSRPLRDEVDTLRARLAEFRWGLRRRGAPPVAAPRRIAMVYEGRLLSGQDTQHRTAEARRWRTVLRLRRQRAPGGSQ